VVILRLRLGHTYLTHGYLLRKELAPVCDTCHVPLTVDSDENFRKLSGKFPEILPGKVSTVESFPNAVFVQI
jgi:hypothetical protein